MVLATVRASQVLTMLRFVLTCLLVLAGSALGDPRLNLTPYIKAGNFQAAKDASLVTGLEPNILSYSGFLTVDEECDANLFFWYFPSQNKAADDPVTLWLNGGPGQSSLFGLLLENGPYVLHLNGTLDLRQFSWNRNSSLIYIDNPVGTGFSYAKNLDCYSTDQTQIGMRLMVALEQFFLIFNDLADNEFFIAGESYAGKFIPAAAYTIANGNSLINLKGILIGNGLTDPVNQINYADYFYQIGLIDNHVADQMRALQEKVIQQVEAEQFTPASETFGVLINTFAENAGFTSYFNYLLEAGRPMANITQFLTSDQVRNAIHVGDAVWHDGNDANIKLIDEKMRSVKPWVEALLEQYRVLIYTGQLNVVINYPITVDYISKLSWSASEEYKTAPRVLWNVGEDLAGYAKTAGSLTEVLVRNAGHYLPPEVPEWSLILFNKFLFNESFGSTKK